MSFRGVLKPRARAHFLPNDVERYYVFCSTEAVQYYCHRFRDDGARSTRRDELRGHAHGHRERAALNHAPTKACEGARALSWRVRVAARAGKSSSYFELDRVKSSYTVQITIGTSYYV